MADIISPERTARGSGPGLSYWLGTKVLGQLLAMEATAATRLQAAIKDKVFDPSIFAGPMGSRFIGSRAGSSGYRVTDDGIAIVPVTGMLLDRGEFLGDMGGWATSYEGLSEQVRRIAKDEAIRAVVLDIDSGGGMAAGLFDFCAQLADLRKVKKLYAVAANSAFSAAYAIGCVADEFYVTRGGGAGSIGTIVVHQSYQRMLDEMGVDTTIIHEGSHKPDGNSFQQLSHGAKAEMCAMVSQANDDFAAHVAAERKLPEATVRGYQARLFWGDKAVEAKLADGIKSFEETLDHIRKTATKGGRPRGKSTTASASKPNQGDPGMTGQSNPGNQPDFQTQLVEAIAAIAANKPAAAAPAVAPVAAVAAPAAEDAGARIFAILDCDEAKARPALARTLAGNAKLSADEAKAILAAAAPETPAAAAAAPGLGDALAAQMAKPGNAAAIKPDAAVNGGAKPSFSQLCGATASNQKA